MALSCRRSLRGVMLLFVFALLAGVASGQRAQSVIVRSTGSRDAMKAAIQSLGGTINQEYQNFNAVAASVPANSMSALMAVPEFKVVKDRVLSLPVPQDGIAKTELIKEVEASENLPLDIDSISQAGQLPSDFAFNNSIIRADALQVA